MMVRTIMGTIVLLIGTISVVAQYGMTFADLRPKLAPYFADELIQDIKDALPQGAEYRIWGWDVGDFTGDGFNDLALSVNVLGTRKRECHVYLFADLDGFLTKVGYHRIPYLELPLEVGVVIKEVTCYVVQKRKNEDWLMRGFAYQGGSMVLVDEFITNKVEQFAHEGYRNFQTLENRERYVGKDGNVAFETQYHVIPCYGRGRQIYAGYVSDVVVDKIRQVQEGSYWWKGPDDASFRVRMVYDADHLYLRVAVTDSNVVTGWCDTCPADRMEIWFDVTPIAELGGSRYLTHLSKGKLRVRSESDSGLYAIAVKIGDFQEIRPSVKIRTTDELTTSQDDALNLVRVVTAQRADGYVVKVRIPFALLGYDRAPVTDGSFNEIGCTVALYDVDNEFRPEETTVLATSDIQPLDPSTYGTVAFIPPTLWYGETTNLFADAVFGVLRELGF